MIKMGLKQENFQDRIFITVTATGAAATGLAPTCTFVDELGNRTAGTVAEMSNGWYKITDFTPDADGTWCTEWAVAGAYTIHYPFKEFKVGGGQGADIQGSGFDAATDSLVKLHDDHITEISGARLGELDAANLPTDVDAILVDTNELQTDWVNGGRLDLLIDAIKAKTDNLPADPADDSDIDAQLSTIVTDTNELQTDWVNGGRLDLLIDAIKTETDQLPNWRFEDKLPTTPTVDAVANAAEVNLTAGTATPTFPSGATRQRATVCAFLHIANKSAATHKIGLTLQIQKAAGGYGDVVDLTANPPVSLANVDGATATFAIVCDVTATVDTSGSAYTIRWQVDSDNAGAVNYTSNFVLIMLYSM